MHLVIATPSCSHRDIVYIIFLILFEYPITRSVSWSNNHDVHIYSIPNFLESLENGDGYQDNCTCPGCLSSNQTSDTKVGSTLSDEKPEP